MTMINKVTLDISERDIEEVGELDFDKLKLDLEILAQQPPVEVHPYYKDKKIDYRMGRRTIIAETEIGTPLEFSYTLSDRASVKGSINYSDNVGMVKYTQEEVDELRD